MQTLNGKIVAVTGASQGIGRAVALRLARANCRVALIARQQERLTEVAREINGNNGEAKCFPCDMSNVININRTFEEIEAHFRAIDVLVNNAGAGKFGPFHQLTLDDVLLPLQVPMMAAIAATHCVIPGMRRRRSGHIVNIVGPPAYFPLAYMVAYNTSRCALNMFSVSLREELSSTGIGVSSVCPPWVNTGYIQNNDTDPGWFPRISKIFPTLQPRQVAEKVFVAIIKNRKELITPFILWAFVRFYQQFPGITFSVLKRLQLLEPFKEKGTDY